MAFERAVDLKQGWVLDPYCMGYEHGHNLAFDFVDSADTRCMWCEEKLYAIVSSVEGTVFDATRLVTVHRYVIREEPW